VPKMSGSDVLEPPESSNASLQIRSKFQAGKNNLHDDDIHTPLLEETLNVAFKKVDPSLCKPWKYHNRDLAWLTKERCQDLIHSIEESGQIEPALVREIQNDPDHNYEIIYGARRWYACLQIPNQKLFVRVTDADDKTCMILMHTENSASKDISEFERAFSFAEQNKSGVFKNQTEMGKAFGLSQGTISKLIKAASIFEYDWIKHLFQNKLDIPIKKSYILSRYLRNPKTLPHIQQEANLILDEQKTLGMSTPPLDILTRLIKAAKPTQESQVPKNISEIPLISSRADKDKIHITIENIQKNINMVEFQENCTKTLKTYLDKLFSRK